MRPSATGSVTTAISRAPAAWAASAIGVRIGNPAKDVGILDDDRAGLGTDRCDQALSIGRGAEFGSACLKLILGKLRRHRASDADIMSAGCTPEEMIVLFRRVIRCAMTIASHIAVEPSYIEALATSQPNSRATWV